MPSAFTVTVPLLGLLALAYVNVPPEVVLSFATTEPLTEVSSLVVLLSFAALKSKTGVTVMMSVLILPTVVPASSVKLYVIVGTVPW